MRWWRRGEGYASHRDVEDLRPPTARTPTVDEILEGPGPLTAQPVIDAGRPFAELRESGILWLVNRSALHPRGFALAIHRDASGNTTGWSIVGDGSEVYAFSEDADDDRFAAAEATLAACRPPAKAWPAWGTFSCGGCGDVKYRRSHPAEVAMAVHARVMHPELGPFRNDDPNSQSRVDLTLEEFGCL